MLQDFSSNKMLNSLREAERLKKEDGKILKKLQETIKQGYAKKMQKETLERQQANALIVKEKTGILSRIASVFHIGKYYESMQIMKAKEEELVRVTEECRRLAEQEEKLEACRAVIEKEKEAISIPECIKEEQGRILITDKNTGLGDYFLARNSDTVEPPKKVLVHCTNFFPRDNKILSDYDGEKIGATTIEYHGVKKETRALIHRHEVHFTINNRVENTGAGEGNWDNPSYIVIDGYDTHKDEMESDDPSDAWTKGTSLQLSDSAVIMVRLQDKDKLPIAPEEINNYNIIYYEGNATTCLRNFLRLNNYDIFHTDPNCPSHAHSTRMMQETGLNTRDLAINFVKDNTYFSKEPPVFSEEEMLQIIDVGYTLAPRILSNQQLRLCLEDSNITKDKRELYFQIANFVVGSGMKIKEDGTYTFKSDDEIFETIEALDEDLDILPSSIDVSLINKVFQMQQTFYQKHKSMQLPFIEEFSSMSLQEIYRFENQLACESLQETLPELAEMIYGKKAVSFRLVKPKDDEEEIGKKVTAEDGIDYTDFGNVGLFELTIDGATSASDVGKIFDHFEQLVQQIRGRDIIVSDFER